MRCLGVVTIAFAITACGDNQAAPIDAGARDAGDAGAGGIPLVPPCAVLGLPGPPAIAVRTTANLNLRDIDGDGNLDLIAADGGVSVLLGHGDGSFGASIDSPTDLTSGSVVSVAIADLDGDGKLDLVEGIQFGAATISVWLGNGTGGFAPLADYPIGMLDVNAIALADLDGDGRVDLVRVDPTTNTMNVRLGNGDGTFGADTGYTVGSQAAYEGGVAVTDLDGDGHPDVAVENWNSRTISVLRGNGDGTFQPNVDYDTNGGPTIIARDLDDDGHVDLVVGGDFAISVLMNNGDGALRDHIDYSVSDEITAFAIGDVDLDGKLDVVGAEESSNEDGAMLVFAGNGDGTFQSAVVTPSLLGANGIAIGDIDGDHAPDLVIASSALLLASIVESNGGGGFLGATTYPMESSSRNVTAADLDGDGYVDLVSTGSSSIDVALGKPQGAFRSLVSYPVDTPTGAVVVADINGDGIFDLIVSSTLGNGPGVSVLLGNGDGTFQNPVASPLTVRAMYEWAIGDFTGDGKSDLVVGSSDPSMGGMGDGSVDLYAGTGDGTFYGPYEVMDYSSDTITAVALGDLNDDGRPDVLVSHGQVCAIESGCHGTAGVDVLLNKNGGDVGAPIRTALPVRYSFLFADLDGDGRLDIVTAGGQQGVLVARGNGDGTLQPAYAPGLFASFASPQQILDVNGDGKLDIVLYDSEFTGGNLSILPGNGDATFRPAGSIPMHSVSDALPSRTSTEMVAWIS